MCGWLGRRGGGLFAVAPAFVWSGIDVDGIFWFNFDL
jgi:hypothetical protein